MSEPTYRPASVADAADIHALLLKHAADIPLAIKTLEQEEALYAAIRKILAFGQSWVALDGDAVAGFVLVENVGTGRHWGENELLTLRYAGAETALAGPVLEALIVQACWSGPRRSAASVKDANRNGLAARLENAGFRLVDAEARVGERRFRREAAVRDENYLRSSLDAMLKYDHRWSYLAEI